MMKPFKYIAVFFMAALMMWSCSKNVDPADNPFIKNADPPPAIDTVNPYSIQGLHKYLFEPKCANPACHDGTFEPDFRTVQSTYSTLVYHPVVKNDSAGTFDFRVVPNDVNSSWLFERLVTGDPVLGRMPLYAPALNTTELQWVVGWINEGAKDMNGNEAQYPNLPPKVNYYFAVDANQVRIDTSRVGGWSSPFKAPKTLFTIAYGVQDDSTATPDLQMNTLKLSQDQDDFSNALSFQATYSFGHWVINLDGNSLTPNVQWYMRYYVEDGDGTGTVEHPTSELPYWFKQNASFIIQ